MKNVLLVEDEQNIRKGMKVLLEEIIGGYRVTESESSEKALALIKQLDVDLLITDVRMSGINGLKLIEKVSGFYKDLPTIVISGYDDFEYVRTALQFGVKDYLLKPISREDLTRLLEKLFPNNHQDDGCYKDHVHKIKDYINNNLSKSLTLKEISDVVYLHPHYVSQLFKTEFNQKLSDYITEARMQYAKRILLNTRLKVYEVAHLCGYRSTKHFLSTFKKYFNATPSMVRKNQCL